MDPKFYATSEVKRTNWENDEQRFTKWEKTTLLAKFPNIIIGLLKATNFCGENGSKLFSSKNTSRNSISLCATKKPINFWIVVSQDNVNWSQSNGKAQGNFYLIVFPNALTANFREGRKFGGSKNWTFEPRPSWSRANPANCDVMAYQEQRSCQQTELYHVSSVLITPGSVRN